MAAKKAKKARLVRRKVNALNIVVIPHPDGRYVEMLQDIMRKKTTFSFFGMRTGLISSFRKETKSDRFYRGTFALFSDINFARAWLNVNTGTEAQEEDVANIQIPPNLRPEYHQIPFFFDAVKHRMVYVSNGLGVTSARNLVEGLLKTSNVLSEQDQLEVTVIQDESNLERMLDEKGIKQLSIEVKIPNPDDLEQAERALFDSLKKQNAKGISQELEADSSNSLKPDEETRVLSKIALNNGRVTTKVQTPKGVVTRSTVEFPKTRILVFEPLNTTEFDALFAEVKHFI